MTPDQRLDRAERILILMIKSGRRTRSEWRYKINSLIDARIRDEAEWRVRTAKIDEQLRQNAVAQAQNAKAIAELRESQKESIAELRESQKESIAELRESQKESIAELRESQKESIAELKESQKLTDKALRTFIESLRKNQNGNSE